MKPQTHTVYLDNNATTQPIQEVSEAVYSALRESYGNPSSTHHMGQQAAFELSRSRRALASCLGCSSEEILFTSGGTESNNLALRGALSGTRKHLITTVVEHESVRRLAQQLEREGHEVTYLAVDDRGQLDLDSLKSAIREDTGLVSIMTANNENGVIFPIQHIGRICHERNILLHTDAVQAMGKVALDLRELPVDLLSLSGHKFHAPKGTGALFVRKSVRLQTQIIGGMQEKDLRGGTENIPGIVGLGVAASWIQDNLEANVARMRTLQEQLESQLMERFPECRIIAQSSPRLPNTTYVSFPGCRAEELLVALSENGICASGGSACHSGALNPSEVLSAMGIVPELAAGAIRISLSCLTESHEVDRLLSVLPKLIKQLKSGSRAN